MNVYTNLSNSNEVQERLVLENRLLPGWFGLPIINSGNNLIFKNSFSLAFVFKNLFNDKTEDVLLCFNPSLSFFIVFLMPLKCSKVSLYQWRPFNKLSLLKKLAVYCILFNSDKILTYSRVSKRYLEVIFPKKEVKLIDLYTDTEYFNYVETITKENFILVVGDHKRNEKLIVDLSKILDIKVMRVTRDVNVKTSLKYAESENFKVLYNVSYNRLRELYQKSKLVLIISDSSEIPTGITSLCEALSTGAKVIISKGLSNIYYHDKEFNHEFLYEIVNNNINVSELAQLINRVHCEDKLNSKRISEFAQQRLSLQNSTEQWYDVLNN